MNEKPEIITNQFKQIRILLTFAALLLFLSARAQTISTAQAKDYTGKNVILCGKVTSVRANKINVYLYFGDAYSKQNFTLVIPGKELRRDKARQPYANICEFKGKTICITGKIEQFDQKPGMILSAFSAMKVQ